MAREATEPLQNTKPDAKPRTPAAIGRSKLKDIDNKQEEGKALVERVKGSTRLLLGYDQICNDVRLQLMLCVYACDHEVQAPQHWVCQ